MKRNKTMRLAAVLLIATLLSTCAISGTFAKYVTSATASDQARVAKFGIEVSASNDTFDDSYTGTGSVKTVNNNGSATLSGISTTNLVAPGTANVGSSTFSIKGTAEVAVDVDITLGTVKDVFLKASTGKYYDYTTGDSTTDTFDLAADYYPVKFTLTHTYGSGAYSIAPAVANTGAAVDTSTANTDVVTGTLAQINSVLANLQASMGQVNPKYTFDDTFTLTWAWDFDTSNPAGANDKADTLLGNLAAGKSGSASTLADGTDYCLAESYSFSITVTQVD